MKRGLIFALIGVLVLAVIVVLVVALTGSKTSTQADNTLTVWSPFDEEATYKQIGEQYLTDNPTVKLSFRYVQAKDAKEYEAKVVDAIANGNGPDIWLVRTDWLAKHQDKLIPSVGYVSWSKDKKKKTDAAAAEEYFGTAIAHQNSREDKLYGYPLAVDSLALYINTKVVNETKKVLTESRNADAEKLDTSPLTWGDLITWSRMMTKKDAKGNITQSGIALGTTGNSYAPVDTFIGILGQYGGSLFTDDEKSVGIHLAKIVDNQSQTPGVEALGLLSSFALPGNPNYTWGASLGTPVEAFVGNRLGMMVGYSSLSKEIQKADKDFDSVRIVPLPQVNDPQITNKRIDVANYWTHVVSKYSNKPLVAWSFLKSLGNAATNKYSQLTSKPLLTKSRDATIKMGSGNLSKADLFAQQVAFAPTTFKPDWQAVDETIQDMLNQAILPSQSVQASIDSAAERLKMLVSQ